MHPLLTISILFAALLAITLSASLFLKHASKTPIKMTDILFLAASIGFFALMLAFAWACEKV
jgi:hypothetical protein